MENLNVRQFKLISGETIIALVNSNNENNYVIERPVIVYANMIGGYQFADWFPFSNQKVYTINKYNIVGDVSIVDEVKATYIKFALTLDKKQKPQIRSEDEVMETLTQNIMDRLNIEVEDEFTEEALPTTKKETIH